MSHLFERRRVLCHLKQLEETLDSDVHNEVGGFFNGREVDDVGDTSHGGLADGAIACSDLTVSAAIAAAGAAAAAARQQRQQWQKQS